MSMRQVAQLAGVSTSTVSRVINERPNVACDTIVSVRKAIENLRFHPARRRGRVTGAGAQSRNGSVAFLVFGTKEGSQRAPTFAKLLRGVSEALSGAELSMLFSFVSNPAELPPRIIERRVDGVLLHGGQPGKDVQHRLEAIPTVWLMGNRQRPRWGDQVMPDNTAIGEMAAQYLLRNGRRHLAYLATGQGSWSLGIRSLAFAKFAQDAGAQAHVLEAAEDRQGDFWNGDGLVQAARVLVDDLEKISPMPTGLFIAEDRLLPTVDAELRRRGIRPGRDGQVLLISCNNELPHLSVVDELPATIDILAESIGRRGVEHLIWRMRNPDVCDRIRTMIEPVLIEPTG